MTGIYMNKIAALVLAVCFVTGCNNNGNKNKTGGHSMEKATMNILASAKDFDSTIDGKKVQLFVLKNKSGATLSITNYGGRIVNLLTPDKNGKLTDVIVGFDNLAGFVNSTEPYFGATIGRYGNRIAKGKFLLDGKEYKLFANNGPNTLHGGKKGFQAVVWDAAQADDSTLVLKYLSKDGEEGFPGNLAVTVIYTINNNNEVVINYEANTDRKTVINLTNHAFFNLNGGGTINNHILQINADYYTPVDATLIPTGEIAAVAGTAFDFTKPTSVGLRLDTTNNEQLKFGRGYDHNFVLSGGKSNGLKLAATISGDVTGITLEVLTQEPGLQFYGGNFMQAKNILKGNRKDEFRTAFCLETQHFPDAPNQPQFPTPVLAPGQTYKTKSVYRFSIAK